MMCVMNFQKNECFDLNAKMMLDIFHKNLEKTRWQNVLQ